MSFGTRLNDKRKDLGITQPQLASMLGVSQSAIGSWETDVNSPRATILYDLFEILHCDANYLLQDETKELYKNEATPEEFEKIIRKYRYIAEHSPNGIKTIDTVLDNEYAIAEQLEKQKDRIQELEAKPAPNVTPMRTKPYYQRMASAGSGEYLFEDIPTDQIEVEDTPLSRKADFVLGVNGQSMEPTYNDGDNVLVRKTSDVSIGHIGVFIRGSHCYIKELGEDRLISHNEDKETYPDIYPDNVPIRVVGAVLGKV